MVFEANQEQNDSYNFKYILLQLGKLDFILSMIK